jgi:uncharacterized protein with HEPN domain
MLADERDAGYLWDMREAVRDCISFVEGTTYEEFSANKMMHSAVERRLEILGEAARRVSDAFQAAHPEIPWKAGITRISH